MSQKIFTSARHRRVLLWTLGLHLFALALAWRIHWETQAGLPPPVRRGPDIADGAPDPSAEALDPGDLAELIGEGSEAWMLARPAEREAALEARLAELQAMSFESASGAAAHVAKTLRVVEPQTRWVPLEEIDIDLAVPVDMELGNDDQGDAGLWVSLQDPEGRRARLWIPAEEIGDEERQAMRVFALLKQNPSLDALRPVLTQLLQGMADK